LNSRGAVLKQILSKEMHFICWKPENTALATDLSNLATQIVDWKFTVILVNKLNRETAQA